MSLARTICDDLKDNAERFCPCCSGCWTFQGCCSGRWTVKGCIASVIAVLLPASFVIQLVAALSGSWAFNDDSQIGCQELSGDGICGLQNAAIIIEGLLMFFGVCICSQTSSSHIDVRACRFCYVCFMPVIALIPGILSVYCCVVTVIFVNNNKPNIDYTYGHPFYMSLVTGCTLIAVSLAAVCGYVCIKNHDRQFDIGSDDADTTPILPARQPVLHN